MNQKESFREFETFNAESCSSKGWIESCAAKEHRMKWKRSFCFA
jgi:hypothetical protein